MSVAFCRSYDENQTPAVILDPAELTEEEFKLGMYPLEKINVKLTNFYADIDIKVEGMSSDEFDRVRSAALAGFGALAGYVFTDGSYSTPAGKKLSFHLHSNKFQIYRESFKWDGKYGSILKKQIFSHFDQDIRTKLEAGLDSSVYRAGHRFMRTPYSLLAGKDAKSSKLHPHRPMVDRPIQEYLITCLPDTHIIHPEMKKEAQRQISDNSFNSIASVLTYEDEAEAPKTRKIDAGKAEALLDCLDPKKRAYEYQAWMKLGFMIKNVFGAQGVDHFVRLSAESGYEKFDENECRTAFHCIQDKNNKVTAGSLVYWAKEDNQEMAEGILAKKKASPPPKGGIIVQNDKEAGVAFYAQVKDIVVLSDGVRYVKIDHAWIPDSSRTNASRQETALLVAAHASNISYQKEDKYVPVYTSLAGAKTMVEELWLNVPNDPAFTEKLSLSTVNKMCFQNGVYDFITKRFLTWSEVGPDVCASILIKDNFRPAMEEDVRKAREMLSSCLGEERVDDFLRYYARRLAGCYTDKGWAVTTGFRDSGKGVIAAAFEASFNSYIGTINAETLLCERVGNGDAAKKLSWAVGVKDLRVVFSQELKLQEDEKSKSKLDGNIIKKFSSGGDKISARTNFKDEMTFYFIPNITIMCNDLPAVSPKDAEETRTIFRCPYKYFSQEKIDEMREKGCNMEFTRLADPMIKQAVKTQPFVDGLRRLIFDSYRPTPYVPSDAIKADNKMFQDDENDEFELINEAFEFTGNAHDIITLSLLRDWISGNNLNMTVKKLKVHLISMGGKHSDRLEVGGHRNVTGITGIKRRE